MLATTVVRDLMMEERWIADMTNVVLEDQRVWLVFLTTQPGSVCIKTTLLS